MCHSILIIMCIIMENLSTAHYLSWTYALAEMTGRPNEFYTRLLLRIYTYVVWPFGIKKDKLILTVYYSAQFLIATSTKWCESPAC